MTIDGLHPAPTPTVVPKAEDVPLRTGPPTREELLAHYPARFTWDQLKTFVNSGDLGLLKRDKKLQVRYNTWAKGIREEYGSMVNYLLDRRLQWGKPDKHSLLPSLLNQMGDEVDDAGTQTSAAPTTVPSYFTADTPRDLISIIMNDWPYSVPPEIEHALIWTRVPVFPPDLPDTIAPRIQQDGMWGFTGSTSPPPSPSSLPSCLPALAEWGITVDKLVTSPKGTDEDEALIRKCGEEVEKFIQRRWVEREWETAWFVNPPRLQSVPGLAHIHVFARHKSPEEISSWDKMRR